MIIADENNNIIFRADENGIHTTALTLSGEAAATEKYVNEAISNIDIPEVDFTGYATEEFVSNAIASIDFPETDLSNYYNKEETDTAINTAKEELSESIVTEADEWKVVDEAGNIIFSIDASGVHTTELTLNGEKAATELYVDDAIANIEFPTTDLTDYATKKYVDDTVDSIEIPKIDFTGYATEDYVDNKVADLVNSAPEALDTLGELATALENHEDAYDALLETVGGKATLADIENFKTELSESIVSGTDGFHIADDDGNIVVSIDENGVTTTTITAHNVVINGADVETELDNLDSTLLTHIENSNIHVTKTDKDSWNNKVDKVDGKGLSTNDFTNDYKSTLDNLGSMTFNEIDPTVPAWAKQSTKPTYTASEIGLGNVDNTSDINKPVSTATQAALNDLKSELSESIVSEKEEWTVVDNQGNIVATISASGFETTAITTQNLILNGQDVNVSSYITKTEMDSYTFITVDDIDAICETTILIASDSGVTF